MNRNAVMPFIIIMVFGIGLMFLLSFKGLGDAKDLAKEKEGGEKTEETESASASPEDIYKQNCISCHGNAYQGGVGPALKGVSDRLSVDEVKDVITNGRGAMPPGLVEEQNIDAMAEYIHGLK
ncbi:cytochrome c550 [Peribacillus sp. RS7]|jgi:cytochrome c550|uniref:cytochrome c550 n=1 Tax=unclassified Peribacillus TaxID=2675266 RepID=UPI0025A0D2BF|nr:cytochrome c [Peribacillus sp. ACCC06369]MDM5359752.1 cytochrome c [Peribacillus sp. ACCC06369]